MDKLISNTDNNFEEFVAISAQNIELNTPVSRRKLGIILGMDDRLLKEYEEHSIITGIKSPGLKNTRFVPRLVLEQIAESIRTEHANKQQLFKAAREHLLDKRKGINHGKEKKTTA